MRKYTWIGGILLSCAAMGCSKGSISTYSYNTTAPTYTPPVVASTFAKGCRCKLGYPDGSLGL